MNYLCRGSIWQVRIVVQVWRPVNWASEYGCRPANESTVAAAEVIEVAPWHSTSKRPAAAKSWSAAGCPEPATDSADIRCCRPRPTFRRRKTAEGWHPDDPVRPSPTDGPDWRAREDRPSWPFRRRSVRCWLELKRASCSRLLPAHKTTAIFFKTSTNCLIEQSHCRPPDAGEKTRKRENQKNEPPPHYFERKLSKASAPEES